MAHKGLYRLGWEPQAFSYLSMTPEIQTGSMTPTDWVICFVNLGGDLCSLVGLTVIALTAKHV